MLRVRHCEGAALLFGVLTFASIDGSRAIERDAYGKVVLSNSTFQTNCALDSIGDSWIRGAFSDGVDKPGLMVARKETEFIINASNDSEKCNWKGGVICERFETGHIYGIEPRRYREMDSIPAGPRSEFRYKFVLEGFALKRGGKSCLLLQQDYLITGNDFRIYSNPQAGRVTFVADRYEQINSAFAVFKDEIAGNLYPIHLYPRAMSGIKFVAEKRQLVVAGFPQVIGGTFQRVSENCDGDCSCRSNSHRINDPSNVPESDIQNVVRGAIFVLCILIGFAYLVKHR